MSVSRIAVLGLLAVALPALGAAQGLGDVAAREKARRAKQAKAEPKVFTNQDLDGGRPPSATGSGDAGAAAESGSEASPAEPAPDDRMAQERPLLDAITSAQTNVSAIEARIKELGDKLNPMSGSFIYGPTGSGDANEEARVRDEMRQAEAQLVEARQALAAANQALQDTRQGRSPAAAAQY
jgi:hypothetical protein